MIPSTYKNFNELGKTIEEEVTRRLFPEAIASYNAGNQVNFGSIQVSYQGISVQNGQKALAWNELKTIIEAGGPHARQREQSTLCITSSLTNGYYECQMDAGRELARN